MYLHDYTGMMHLIDNNINAKLNATVNVLISSLVNIANPLL